MKNWAIFCFFLCFLASAQDTFNTFDGFGIDKKYGLVNVENQTEIIAPSYAQIIFTFTDYVGFKNETDVDLFSKKTGEKLSFKETYQTDLYLKRVKYTHFQDQNFSYLISNVVSERLQLPKKYQSLSTQHNYLIAFAANSYDVYKDTNLNVPKIAALKASAFHSYIANVAKQDDFSTVNVFYGLGTIYVYSEEFELLKTYKNKAKDQNKMLTVLQKDFPAVDTKEMMQTSMIGYPNWRYEHLNGVTKVSLFSDPKKYFYVAKKCEAQLVPGNDDWVEIQLLESKGTYQFMVDFEHQRFNLPAKYIQELGLKFEN